MVHGIARPLQQVDGFVERQADDVGIGAVEAPDEDFGAALDGVAAGLAAPFVRPR